MFASKSVHWIITPLCFSLLFLYLGAFISSVFYLLSIISFLFFIFFLVFYRDPKRIPDKKNGMVCPADGKVLAFRGDDKIRIFMNVNNVHVNRSPIEGKIIKMKHFDGGYLPAYSKDSDRNERLVWTVKTDFGNVEIVQIAGALVRRIVPYKKTGDKIFRGERIGIIRFGSRVDVSIPKGFCVCVKENEKVFAGKTIIAEKKN